MSRPDLTVSLIAAGAAAALAAAGHPRPALAGFAIFGALLICRVGKAALVAAALTAVALVVATSPAPSADDRPPSGKVERR